MTSFRNRIRGKMPTTDNIKDYRQKPRKIGLPQAAGFTFVDGLDEGNRYYSYWQFSHNGVTFRLSILPWRAGWKVVSEQVGEFTISNVHTPATEIRDLLIDKAVTA